MLKQIKKRMTKKSVSSIASVATAVTLLMGMSPSFASAATGGTADKYIPQGNGSAVLQNANFFGNLDPSTKLSVDIVLKVQHKQQLADYIKKASASTHGHPFLSVDQFKKMFAPSDRDVNDITAYLKHFNISSNVYSDNLVITATGTVADFNKAFSVKIEKGKFKGKEFHGTRKAPKAPSHVADKVLAILGLSDYSNFHSNTIKQPSFAKSDSPQGPLSLDPSDLVKRYNVQPLYDQGATGKGQTMGIVTLANFNPQDAYTFWQKQGIKVKPNRISVNNVDGGSGYDGYDETSLDVEQSGALAPDANIDVYVGPNTDSGFVDAFAKAINDNKSQQISVSWGESETAVIDAVNQKVESPEYAEVFNQLFMQAAAQGISMFAAAGDAGAYDSTRSIGTYDLSVDNPADSPYMTAAGGTTVPFHFHSNATGVDVAVNSERAWGWDYLYNYFDARGLNTPDGWLSHYFVGGGGGFSALFGTPYYQQGVSGVNQYDAVKQWQPNSDFTSVSPVTPTVVSGTGNGRNMPDLSMNADPYTGYKVWFSDPGAPGQNAGYAVYGGTSFVSPQLNGLSALINSADHTQVGFWNQKIYQFAQQANSPFTPLNTTGGSNDNIYYTGKPGTIYNQATGLGTPDVAALAQSFADKNDNHHDSSKGHNSHKGH